jgi:hypothetical protein
MSFRNLAAENQPDAGASRLGGEKGYEEICSVGQTWTVINHPQLHLPALSLPPDLNASFCLQGRIRGIANQVD